MGHKRRRKAHSPTVATAIALGLTTEEEHRREVETFPRKDMVPLAMAMGLTREEAERACDEWGFRDGPSSVGGLLGPSPTAASGRQRRHRPPTRRR